jgi:hypothetical protein
MGRDRLAADAMRKPRLALIALLLCSSCSEPGTRGDRIYPGVADEVFRELYTRTIEFRAVKDGASSPVRRVETGDLPVPPYAEWHRPTFDEAELARIASSLERVIAARPLSSAPVIQRAFFARDLWMAFDEMAGQGDEYEHVQRLLARAIVEIAPSRAELEAIRPPSYEPPVPPDLGDARAGWAEMKAQHHELWEGVPLPVHTTAARGHSYVRIFMKFDRGSASDHVGRMVANEPVDLPRGIDVVLLECASFLSRELDVVPTGVVLTYQARRIEDPSTHVGEVLEFTYRRRKVFAGWRDAGLERTEPQSEGHCSLSISNPVVGGDTLEGPLQARCAQCHNPQGWTNEPEMRSRRLGSIRSLVPNGGGGLGTRDEQIAAMRRVLDEFGNLRRLRSYAGR